MSAFLTFFLKFVNKCKLRFYQVEFLARMKGIKSGEKIEIVSWQELSLV
jgi:hypothetical protein